MPENNLVRLDVRITPAELDQLRTLAAARGCSVAALVRVKLRTGLVPVGDLLTKPAHVRTLTDDTFTLWRTTPGPR